MAEQSTTQPPPAQSGTPTKTPQQQAYSTDQTVPITLTLSTTAKPQKRTPILFSETTTPIPHAATTPINLIYTPPRYLSISSLSTYRLLQELLPCIPWPDTNPQLRTLYQQTWLLAYSDFKLQSLYTSLTNDLHTFTTVRETRDTILDAQDTRISTHDLSAEELLPMATQRLDFCKAFLQESRAYLSRSKMRAKEATDIATESYDVAVATTTAYIANTTSNTASSSTSKPRILTIPTLRNREYTAKLLHLTNSHTTASAMEHIQHAKYFSSKDEKDTKWFRAQIKDVKQQLAFFEGEVRALEREVVAEKMFGGFDLGELGAWFGEACRGDDGRTA